LARACGKSTVNNLKLLVNSTVNKIDHLHITFDIMVLEEQRLLHEDIERLEQAIADRLIDEPTHASLSVSR
jgi:hypothetical protein